MNMLDSARAHFPEVVAYLLCFGAPLGLTLGIWGSLHPPPGQRHFSLPRALVVGGTTSIVGGWVFSKWMEQANFFPLIGGLLNSNSSTAGMTLHFLVAVVIGLSFGLLFQRDVRGYGSCLGWGLAYGIFWWFLGPLTLLPLLERSLPSWSYQQGSALFSSLIGCAIYGVVVKMLICFPTVAGSGTASLLNVKPLFVTVCARACGASTRKLAATTTATITSFNALQDLLRELLPSTIFSTYLFLRCA